MRFGRLHKTLKLIIDHSSHLISLLCPKVLKLTNTSHLFSALPSSCCYKSLRGKCGIGALLLYKALLGALLLYKVYSLQQVWHGRGHYCSTRLLLANGITSCWDNLMGRGRLTTSSAIVTILGRPCLGWISPYTLTFI